MRTDYRKNVANAADGVLLVSDVIRSVKIAFACCFKEPRLSTTGPSDIGHIKYVGHISTIMRALTSKDGDLLSQSDKTDETQAQIQTTPLKHLLINNNDKATNKAKLKVTYLLNIFLYFVEHLKRLLHN